VAAAPLASDFDSFLIFYLRVNLRTLRAWQWSI